MDKKNTVVKKIFNLTQGMKLEQLNVALYPSFIVADLKKEVAK